MNSRKVTTYAEKQCPPAGRASAQCPPAGRASAPLIELVTPPSEAAHRSLASKQRLAAAVASHHQLVWRALRRFGVPERDVDDAAQQVFLAFSNHLAEVEVGKEAAYLAAVGVRVAANARRKLERSPEVLSDELESAAAAHTPEGLLTQKQLREELDRGLAALPLEQRAVFVLFELEGFSLPEIGEALQIPLGTATSRLRRARVHFEAWAMARDAAARGEP
jgi:RNA polymerase sigma-70 factor, ECF subfamily